MVEIRPWVVKIGRDYRVKNLSVWFPKDPNEYEVPLDEGRIAASAGLAIVIDRGLSKR